MKLNLTSKLLVIAVAVFVIPALLVVGFYLVAASGSATELNAGWLKLSFLGIIGVWFLIVVIALGMFSRSVSRRLELLARMVDAISSGKRNVVVPVFKGSDEISILSKSLNVMCGKFERYRRELEEMNNSLEERVDKRNADLRRLNDKLSKYAKGAESQAHRIRQADAYKTQFIANMSHDLRTPLNGILGMADIIKKTTLTTQQKEYLNDIISSGELLAAIINDILDLSKMEAGRLNLEKRAFDMKKAIEDVSRVVAAQAKQKNLFFYYDYPEDVLRYVSGDPVRISQILMNLLSNAIKFTDVGGVKLEVAGGFPKNETSVFTFQFKVHDTGIGIPVDRQGCLFEKFVQFDDSITRRRSGAGLGLSICKKLTEIMHGSIQVDSKYGRGSTFTVEIPLPIANQNDVQVVVGDDENLALNWRRMPQILVAEDSAINQKIVRNFIESSGCACTLVGDGYEAIELFKNGNFDLIFMDIQMPNLDGIAAIREIRTMEQKGRRPATPIVALTAHVMAREQKACIEAGADGFLFKPLTEKDLKVTLRRYLRSLLVSEQADGDTESVSSEPLHGGDTASDDNNIERKAETSEELNPGTEENDTIDADAVKAAESSHSITDSEQNRRDKKESAIDGDNSTKEELEDNVKENVLAKTLLMSSPACDIDLSGKPIFNRQKAISNFAGNRELLEEMVDYFTDNLDKHIDKLESALQQEDFKTVDSVSHLIKGEAGTLCIERIQLAAGQLEQVSRNRDRDKAKQAIEILKTQIREFLKEVQQL